MCGYICSGHSNAVVMLCVGIFDVEVSISAVFTFCIYRLYSRYLVEHLLGMSSSLAFPYEPRCGKTGLRGFRPVPTQTTLHNHRRKLEA